MSEQLILVDEHDRAIGTEEKLRTHEKGLLHRAFSIFVFNHKNELMLQQRAFSKYHSPGLWSNTCCGHPRPGEITEAAAKRRLQEEMGFGCFLKEVTQFTYKVAFSNSLFEHEFLHVFIGSFEGQPIVNPDEAADWKWMSLLDIADDMAKHPDAYTYWFKIAFDKVQEAKNAQS
jgi:isopentenyl-diphosphate delta-isomerase